MGDLREIFSDLLLLTLLPAVVLSSPRESPTPLVGSVTHPLSFSTPNCSNGFGQLNLTIVNLASNNATYKDLTNMVTISRQPLGNPASTIEDSEGLNPDGVYLFPCVMYGLYLLNSTHVSGNATIGNHYACGTITGCTVDIPAGTGTFGGGLNVTWNVIPNGYGATPQTNTTNPTPTKTNDGGGTGLAQVLARPLVLTVIGAWLALVAIASIIVTRRKRQEFPTTA